MSALQSVIFCLERQRYALAAMAVERVVLAVAITPLPGAPALVQGVVDVGGRVLPVLDLRRRMELPGRAPKTGDQLMIVDTGSRSVVLPVDEVLEVVATDPGMLCGDELAAASRGPFLGLLQLAGGLVWIHDVERLFSSADADAFDRALGNSYEPEAAC